MKIVTLLENTACDANLVCDHGLSLYIETRGHRILFDMGPDEKFVANAKALGVDLSRVDTAVLSHAHCDHGGGMEAFCAVNSAADIWVHSAASGAYYAVEAGKEPRCVDVRNTLEKVRDRLVYTDGILPMGEMILFSDVALDERALSASAMLCEKTEEGFCQDRFAHEQHLLVTEGGKTVLFAGCAHRGIVSIMEAAERVLGRRPDVTFGGFHLFRLAEGDPAGDDLIRETGEKLLAGDTVYYTGHCTGQYAYSKLKDILGDRLQPMQGGTVVEL